MTGGERPFTRAVERLTRATLLGFEQTENFYASSSWIDTSVRLVRGFVTAAEKIVTNDNRGAMSPKDGEDEDESREGE